MGLYFIFRVCRANKKNSNVTIVAEYPLYIRNVHIFLDISTGIRNATLPDIFYLYKRLRALHRIGGIQSDEYRTSDEVRSQEGIYRKFLERTKENADKRKQWARSIYVWNILWETKQSNGWLQKTKSFTLDYCPAELRLSSEQICDLADRIYESVMCWDGKEITQHISQSSRQFHELT